MQNQLIEILDHDKYYESYIIGGEIETSLQVKFLCIEYSKRVKKGA